jgi:hemerythrin-like metal-binding protein
MRRFTWDTDHEVFLGQVDAEHRELFRIAGNLDRALNAAVAEEVKAQLGLLVARAEEHFQHEEWLMQSSAYPSYGWHKQQHETVRRRLKLFIPLIQSGDKEASELFLEFLDGWLHDHTGVTDRMMAAYLRNYEREHGSSSGVWSEQRAAPKPAAEEVGPYPRSMRFCRSCGAHTPHEMRPPGMTCLSCSERAVSADLDRE